MIGLAKAYEAQGQIDSLSNFKDNKVFIYGGTDDQSISKGVVDKTYDFFHDLHCQ